MLPNTVCEPRFKFKDYPNFQKALSIGSRLQAAIDYTGYKEFLSKF